MGYLNLSASTGKLRVFLYCTESYTAKSIGTKEESERKRKGERFSDMNEKLFHLALDWIVGHFLLLYSVSFSRWDLIFLLEPILRLQFSFYQADIPGSLAF